MTNHQKGGKCHKKVGGELIVVHSHCLREGGRRSSEVKIRHSHSLPVGSVSMGFYYGSASVLHVVMTHQTLGTVVSFTMIIVFSPEQCLEACSDSKCVRRMIIWLKF